VIIQSLVWYYDILAADDTAKISKPGYSQANVSFALVISNNGELINIIDLQSDGKKYSFHLQVVHGASNFRRSRRRVQTVLVKIKVVIRNNELE
jgi:hypothetical protein